MTDLDALKQCYTPQVHFYYYCFKYVIRGGEGTKRKQYVYFVRVSLFKLKNSKFTNARIFLSV